MVFEAKQMAVIIVDSTFWHPYRAEIHVEKADRIQKEPLGHVMVDSSHALNVWI